MVRLIVKEAKQPSRKVDFGGRTVIGRMTECDVVIKDGHSSRKHAVIYRAGGDYFVRDLNTRNGTLVNGEKITTRRLRPEDDVRIGLTHVRLDFNGTGGASGQTIAGMEVFEALGHGSLSSTCRAQHPRLDRNIALKRYAVEKGEDTDSWIRSTAAGALDHPNIATVYDIGVEGDEKYVAMEFIRGMNLKTRLSSEDRLPPTECLSIMLQTAEALAHAHNNGAIHGNLRPSKIYVQPAGSVKVVDFALAPPAVSKSGDNSELKVDPSYLSPEQCLGEKPGAASDIYSLGAIFYQGVTGHPLFQGSEPRDIIQRQILHSPVPAREIVPELPDAVVSILNRMLAKSPSERFASGPEVVDALKPLVEQSTSSTSSVRAAAPATSTPRPTSRQSTAKPEPGSPGLALVVGFLLIVMLCALYLGGREMGKYAIGFKQEIIRIWNAGD